ncbi:MAG: hypothetical protein ACIAQZ_07520 [Sedimentisphaeraceae bacterium JB056]
MKSFKMIYLLAAIILAVLTPSMVKAEVFAEAGMTGWTTIGDGNAYDVNDGGTLKPFEDLVTFTSPANTNDYGVDGATWGWDAFQIKAIYCQPGSGAYVGYRYEAPAGKIITEVNIPKIYTNVSNIMHLQIADDSGVVAELTPAGTTTLNELYATELSTSSVEIRWVNSHSSTINLWAGNGFIVNTVEVVTEDAPLEGAETLTFAAGGFEGWEYVGGGTGYDADNGNAESPLEELMTLATPSNTNDYGVDGATWGWDVAKISPNGHILPNSGAYVGVRYEAPAGKMVTGVRVPKYYTNVDLSMHLKIYDADGVELADSTRVGLTEMVTDLAAADISTSAIEIRWVNTAASTIHFWGTSNGVIINTAEVDIANDPDYQAYNPITFDTTYKPSQWFGYYHAYTVVSDDPLGSTNWGDAIADVGGYTNLNYVFPKQGAIDSAVANHSYMLVDVMWQLFESDGNGGYQLKSSYESAVDSLVTMFNGYEEYIGAFSPIDEPYHRNVSQSDLEASIAALKAGFPGIPIYVNFAYTEVDALTSLTLPAGADWLAFDVYESDGQPVDIADIQGYVNHIKSIKLPEQKLFLIPPSAMNLVATYTDQQLADSVNAFYNLMSNDDEIIGMMVFPADGCRQAEFDGIGSTIPLALAAQQAIGGQIAGEVCGDIWNGLYKFDFDADCHITMADFAAYAVKWIAE